MKSGSLFLTLVLLAVLAIPLFADHTLGNTVGEFSAISIPVKEKPPVQDVTAPYSEIIGLMPKPAIPLWLPPQSTGKRSNRHEPVENAIFVDKANTKYGGARRIKSGRH